MTGTNESNDGDGRGGEQSSEHSASTAGVDRRWMLRALPTAALTGVAGCGGIGGEGGDTRSDLVPGETAEFSAVIAFEDRYEMTTTVEDGATVTGRFDGENRTVRYETGDRVVTFSVVDGDGYLVSDGDCVRYPDVTATLEENRAAVTDRAADAAAPTLTVDRTTTLDEAEVWVLELDEGFEGVDGAVTYYVDVATNHMRRVDLGATVVDYRSWGAVDPVEPPADDCRTVEPASRSLVPGGPSF